MRPARPLIALVLALVVLLAGATPLWAATEEAVLAGGCFWCLEHDLEDLPGVLDVTSGYSGGKVADVLIAYAKADPIVMGSRGLTPLAALLLGSSADRTAGRSQGPVFIVRKKGSTMSLVERLFHRI